MGVSEIITYIIINPGQIYHKLPILILCRSLNNKTKIRQIAMGNLSDEHENTIYKRKKSLL